jgi:2,3-diketo-5-methylthio-1-phosphopentane phosphatase
MKDAVVFIDFDGTICPVDISYRFFRQFAGIDARLAVEEWKKGKISSRECLIRELEAYKGSIEHLLTFASSQPIDPGFKDLQHYCDSVLIPLSVVSDGLDVYIDAFFKAHRISAKVYSNQLLMKDGKMVVEFPYFNSDCGRCGNCKSSHVIAQKREGKTVVYVGDGLSDRCAASNSDIVFAKGDLRQYCIDNGTSFIEFTTLADVLKKMVEIFEKSGRQR